VLSAAFSPDGKRIVTASGDKTARVWDVETGKQIDEPLKGHAGAVLSAAFSPDGKRIVTASGDKTARLWDAETGKQIGEPLKGHAEGLWSAAFSPDGKRIVTASGDKTARLWKVFTNTQEAVSHAKAVTPRCLSAAQRKNFGLPAEPPLWCIERELWPYHALAWKQWLSDTRAGKNPPLPAGP
jgi:WD40 repeat protein